LAAGPADVERTCPGRALQVRLMVNTKPGQQFLVTRKLRQYAIEALQAENLHLGVPVTLVRNVPGEGEAPGGPAR